ncbi:MAG TPA: hypothetical protein VJQ82_02685 [Terriglobales bacterium]|nr:hypothetical protein [Terriglobales bacterium]
MTEVKPKTVWRGVVRKQEFDVRDLTAVYVVLEALSGNNHTGSATVNFSQGGIQSMVAEDKAKLPA